MRFLHPFVIISSMYVCTGDGDDVRTSAEISLLSQTELSVDDPDAKVPAPEDLQLVCCRRFGRNRPYVAISAAARVLRWL